MSVPTITGVTATNITTSSFTLEVALTFSGYGDDFVIVMATTTPNETVTIPCDNVGTFNATVDWGDATTSTITAWDDADLTHEYATAGDHTIRISGSFPNIYFRDAVDRLKLKKILNWGDTGFVTLRFAFRGCENLTEATSNGNTNTSAVGNIMYCFSGCTSLETLDVSDWDTSSVGSIFFGQAFEWCEALQSVDVSGFDTSNVTGMFRMFRGCVNITNLGISNWNITSLTDAGSFLASANNALTTAEYDATLVAWEAQAYNNNVPAHFGDATYTAGSAAATARAQLVTDGWTITDGGPV